MRCQDAGLGRDGFHVRSFCLVRCDEPNCMQPDYAARATCDELRKARHELQARFGREIGALCSSFPLFVVSSRPVAFERGFGSVRAAGTSKSLFDEPLAQRGAHVVRYA